MKTSARIKIIVASLGMAGLLLGAWIYQYSFVDFESAPEVKQAALFTEARFGVETLGKPEQPTVLTDALTHHGEPAEVACATCHTTRTPAATSRADELDEFHQGLVVAHGNLTCLSCHNSENYETLKLADGRAVEFEQTMQLCAQCHGPQSRDYARGSHGGMVGYWDLSRGPRQRNACTVCHDAHAPAYPELLPVFPPKDIIPPEGGSHAEY